MPECIDCRLAHDRHKSFWQHATRPGTPDALMVRECPMPPPIAEGTHYVVWPKPFPVQSMVLNPVPLTFIDSIWTLPRTNEHGPVCEPCKDRWLASLSRSAS